MVDDERPRKLMKTDHADTTTGTNVEEDRIDLPSVPAVAAFSNQEALPAAHDGVVNEKTSSFNVASDNGNFPTPEDVAPSIIAAEVNAAAPPISKNALKKLRKKQEWESKRDERKILRKEKATARKERKKAAKHQEAALNAQNGIDDSHEPKLFRPRSVRSPVTLLIDCDFDSLMRDNERISLAGQITRAYSCNKNSPLRADLAICAFSGSLKDRFDTVLTHHKQWRGVQWLTEDFVTAADMARTEMIDNVSNYRFAGAFAKYHDADHEQLQKLKDEAEIVYLSAESNETITELKPFSTYIIGGLVDKNREKGLCHRRAVQRGVRTGRLPIGEFLELQSRKVLATNHVCEIMIAWMECKDWGEAFMKVIPKRKGGKLKDVGDDMGTEQDDGEDSAPENET